MPSSVLNKTSFQVQWLYWTFLESFQLSRVRIPRSRSSFVFQSQEDPAKAIYNTSAMQWCDLSSQCTSRAVTRSALWWHNLQLAVAVAMFSQHWRADLSRSCVFPRPLYLIRTISQLDDTALIPPPSRQRCDTGNGTWYRCGRRVFPTLTSAPIWLATFRRPPQK